MGLWDHTAYVQAPVDEIVGALRGVFDRAGRTAVVGPVAREPWPRDPMQYGSAAACSRWAAAVIAGPSGWSAVKTAPFELLCEPDESGTAPRLAALGRELGCCGFQLNLYDAYSTTLVEAGRTGAFHVSGFVGADGPGAFCGFEVAADRFEARLYQLEVPGVNDALAAAFLADGVVAVRRLLMGPIEPLDNLVQVQYLIPGEPLPIPGAHAVYGEAAEA